MSNKVFSTFLIGALTRGGGNNTQVKRSDRKSANRSAISIKSMTVCVLLASYSSTLGLKATRWSPLAVTPRYAFATAFTPTAAAHSRTAAVGSNVPPTCFSLRPFSVSLYIAPALSYECETSPLTTQWQRGWQGNGLRSLGGYDTRCFVTSSSPDDTAEGEDDDNQRGAATPKSEQQKSKSERNKKPRKKKIKVNPNWQKEANIDALVQEFNKMARKEGFDPSSSFYTVASTFENDFVYDDDNEETGYAEGSGSLVGKTIRSENDGDEDDLDLNPEDFDVQDFDFEAYKDDAEEEEEEEYDGDEFLDFGSDFDETNDVDISSKDKKSLSSPSSLKESMEERIAAAKRDLDMGRVTISEERDDYAREVTMDDLRKLGFRRELNPFGDDETPRKEQFKLITDAMVCQGCGATFQSKNENKPGYLPPEKHSIQVKLGKIEQMQKLQEKAEAFEWSPEDEIEWLIQSEGGVKEGGNDDGDLKAPRSLSDTAAGIDIDAMAKEMGLDLVELSKKKVICKRCHGLQNFGKVDDSLRPGWTKEPLLSQEAFRDLLKPIREKTAVIVALVDIFDFSGSVLPELDAIAGDNPVLLAANKVDLLPSKMGQHRAENWVRRELEYMGIQSIANVGGAVRLVSCKTGFGLSALLGKARSMAEEMDCDVYVVGAANAGKSTLINHILDKNEQSTAAYRFGKKSRPGNANAKKGAVTTSPLPGTTLKFIKVDLGNGRSLYDTPGLLVPGTLTQILTPAELKMVVPKKEVEPITFRVASGKCVLVGGLARIEVVGDSKPFLFTFFVANDIKIHPTDSDRANDFIADHAGGLLTPPLEPGKERMAQIGEFESHTIEIEGAGWKEAAADITLRGLGWVAVTGAGTAKVRISVPKGIGISVRPPLMPFDIWEVAAKYTGGRAVRKSSRSKSGKRRGGVGRR